jgi:hypothetical protein
MVGCPANQSITSADVDAGLPPRAGGMWGSHGRCSLVRCSGDNLPHHLHRGQEGKYRTMKISCTPVSESRFPNSEIRMAYGGSGIPHHEIRGSRGRARGAGGRILGRCNGVGHGVSYHGVLCK